MGFGAGTCIYLSIYIKHTNVNGDTCWQFLLSLGRFSLQLGNKLIIISVNA